MRVPNALLHVLVGYEKILRKWPERLMPLLPPLALVKQQPWRAQRLHPVLLQARAPELTSSRLHWDSLLQSFAMEATRLTPKGSQLFGALSRAVRQGISLRVSLS